MTSFNWFLFKPTNDITFLYIFNNLLPDEVQIRQSLWVRLDGAKYSSVSLCKW